MRNKNHRYKCNKEDNKYKISIYLWRKNNKITKSLVLTKFQMKKLIVVGMQVPFKQKIIYKIIQEYIKIMVVIRI